MKKLLSLLAASFLAFCPAALAQSSSAQPIQLGFLSMATTGSAGCTTLGLGLPPCFVPYSAANPMAVTTTPGGGGGGSGTVTSITAGSANIVVSPSSLTTTGTIDLSPNPSVTSLTAATVTGVAINGGTLGITGNASLSGTTTIANLAVNAFAAPQTAIKALEGQPPLYVTNSGAKCDGLFVSDITSTSGSATISSASHNFVAADIGKSFSGWLGTSTTGLASTTSSSNILSSVGSLTGLVLNETIIGNNVPAGAKIVDFPSATTIAMNVNATATAASQTMTYVNALNTTISGISGTSGVLAATTSTSITGVGRAYFGSDDTAALNAADATALAAGGGLLQLPLGICMVSGAVILDTKVSMNGLGWGKSVLFWSSTSSQTVPIVESRTQANGAVPQTCNQGVANTQLDNHLTYFEVDGEAAISPGSYNVSSKGVGFACSANSILDHLYVHDTLATAIGADVGFPTSNTNNLIVNPGRSGGGQAGANANAGSNGIGNASYNFGGDSYIITGNVVINPAHYGIFIETSSNLTTNTQATIDDNIVIAGGNSQNVTVSATNYNVAGIGNSGISRFVANGNIIIGNSNTTWNGINTDPGTYNTGASGIQSNITGNQVFNANLGIYVNYTEYNPASSGKANTIIAGNSVYGSTSSGIELSPNATGSSMDGVNISTNLVTSSGQCGVAILAGTAASTVKNLTINGNTLAGNGTTTATNYRQAGICFNNVNTAGLNIQNNIAYDDTGSTQKYALGINVGTNTNAMVTGNNWIGVTTSAYLFPSTGTLEGIVKDNLGDNKFSLSGGCSSTTPVGDGSNGTFLSGTTGTCSTVINANGTANIIAPNGYNCFANDLTTNSDLLNQIASTTTGATISGTTISGDKIGVGCRPY